MKQCMFYNDIKHLYLDLKYGSDITPCIKTDKPLVVYTVSKVI